jgi:hypothetical protein
MKCHRERARLGPPSTESMGKRGPHKQVFVCEVNMRSEGSAFTPSNVRTYWLAAAKSFTALSGVSSVPTFCVAWS